jgi:hypothetical protein
MSIDSVPSLEEIEKKFMSYQQVVIDGKIYQVPDGIK